MLAGEGLFAFRNKKMAAAEHMSSTSRIFIRCKEASIRLKAYKKVRVYL
jgi:hypothetical protein